jgi:hypothetical protein
MMPFVQGSLKIMSLGIDPEVRSRKLLLFIAYVMLG